MENNLYPFSLIKPIRSANGASGKGCSVSFIMISFFIQTPFLLPTGEWRYQSAESAASYLAHETKHWIDKKVLSKMDEQNKYSQRASVHPRHDIRNLRDRF